ncbi:hypothetical protein BDR26DRAFT_872861 [Obelidium mucronatum]|nr:hypothetical protein BDR26DRAFT_872861 [Obelidium mucronatum]
MDASVTSPLIGAFPEVEQQPTTATTQISKPQPNTQFSPSSSDDEADFQEASEHPKPANTNSTNNYIDNLFGQALDAAQFNALRQRRLLEERNRRIRTQLLMRDPSNDSVHTFSSPVTSNPSPKSILTKAPIQPPSNKDNAHLKRIKSPRMSRFQSSIRRQNSEYLQSSSASIHSHQSERSANVLMSHENLRATVQQRMQYPNEHTMNIPPLYPTHQETLRSQSLKRLDTRKQSLDKRPPPPTPQQSYSQYQPRNQSLDQIYNSSDNSFFPPHTNSSGILSDASRYRQKSLESLTHQNSNSNIPRYYQRAQQNQSIPSSSAYSPALANTRQPVIQPTPDTVYIDENGRVLNVSVVSSEQLGRPPTRIGHVTPTTSFGNMIHPLHAVDPYAGEMYSEPTYSQDGPYYDNNGGIYSGNNTHAEYENTDDRYQDDEEPTNDEPVNWVVVENEQNGLLLVMDATSANIERNGYGNVVECPIRGSGADPMRYLNIVETEPNAYRYVPSASPTNVAANLGNAGGQHQGHNSPALMKIPTNSHPNASIIKKQPAVIMQRNHLSHLMTSAKQANGSTSVVSSPGSQSPIGVSTFLSRFYRRMRAAGLYSVLLMVALYIKDPAAFLRQAKKVQKMVLAYAVLFFGNRAERAVSQGVDLSLGNVLRIVLRGVGAVFGGLIVEGGRALGYNVVVEKRN